MIMISALFFTALPIANAYDGTTLDHGIYWYGSGNVSQKAVAGVGNPYYNPTKPTIIYVHGWQKDTTATAFRETFNYLHNDASYGVNVNTADAWVSAGWNIGIFYWNQFADEAEVKDAEAKIWTATGPKAMRWRKKDGTYIAGPTKSAGDLFYDAYASAMSNYTGSNIRIAGHSLGNQMAVRLTKLVSDKVTAGQLDSKLLPKRVALLDPFWSKDPKSYLNNKWTGEETRNYVSHLKTKGIIFEQYKSSGITDVGVGDMNAALEKMTAFSRLAPWYIPAQAIANKHIAAPNWYFYSYASAPPLEIVSGSSTSNGAASAKTSDARILQMMTPSYEWVQTQGRETANPTDDAFEKKAR
ncbi:cell adhesion domain-containing protein [Paenibacillus swuensis]|uniref:Cell adhesion domain-containing protein n=2 Tax=Paenibacillus swuensis TaxID=1178515 RepID=A0A172TPH3_9BACL|nr:cell adhesion domain-containing protein [Paenibacillus swuensis]